MKQAPGSIKDAVKLAAQDRLAHSRTVYKLRHPRMEHKGLKILSLLLAFVLYLISRQPLTEVRLSGVPVDFSGLAPGLEITSAQADSVSLRVRGPRDVVRGLTSNQLLVSTNLSNKESGERVVQLWPDNVSRPADVQVLQIEPASISLQIEPTVRKFVAVQPQITGQTAEGYEVYRVAVEPPAVEIEGPQAQVTGVSKIMTEGVNLSGRRESFRADVEVELPKSALRVVTRGPVNLSIVIGERRASRLLTKIPVQGLPPPHPEVEVLVYGPPAAIEALRPGDVIVEVSAASRAATAETVPLQVRLRPGLEGRIEIKKVTPNEVKRIGSVERRRQN
jgi:hypothetical protein